MGSAANSHGLLDSASGAIGHAGPKMVGKMTHVPRTEDQSPFAARTQQGRTIIGGRLISQHAMEGNRERPKRSVRPYEEKSTDLTQKGGDPRGRDCGRLSVEQTDARKKQIEEEEDVIPPIILNVEEGEGAAIQIEAGSIGGIGEEIGSKIQPSRIGGNQETSEGRTTITGLCKVSVEAVNMVNSRYDPNLVGDGIYYSTTYLCGTDTNLRNSPTRSRKFYH